MSPEEEKICDEHLYTLSRDSYRGNYEDHLIEQYKAYKHSIDFTSSLKHKVNSYFLTINTILITAVGISLAKPDFFDPTAWNTIVPIVGVLLGLIWWYTTRTYKQVNQVKFKILHCLEKRLPAAPYRTEWAMIMKERGGKMGQYPSTRIEPTVPWVFIILYVLIFFFIG